MILLDTQLLVWAVEGGERLSRAARAILEDPPDGSPGALLFSPVSVWEVAVKAALGKPDFAVEPEAFVAALRAAGLREVAVTARHAVAVYGLPAIHADPFDRLLVAQARAEGLTLLTADRTLRRYGDPVRLA